MNKDRYRYVFCEYQFYSAHQSTFSLWKSRFSNLKPVEKTLAWVVGLGCLRRSDDWFGGQRQNKFSSDTKSFQHPFSLKNLFEGTSISIPNKIDPEINLIDFINQVRIKAFPETCLRGLFSLSAGIYPLIITEKIPTPHELLKIQITGQRVISINEDFESWPDTLYAGRDYLGFLMHDLIHADHFFHKPEYRNAQLGFFIFIENLLSDDSLVCLQMSEKFNAGFEYIISDMNSHPVHLFQTFKSLVYQQNKNDFVSEKIWNSWLNKSSLNLAEIDALKAINFNNFNPLQARTIELLCCRLVNNFSF